jgi:hypothetical protein
VVLFPAIVKSLEMKGIIHSLPGHEFELIENDREIRSDTSE